MNHLFARFGKATPFLVKPSTFKHCLLVLGLLFSARAAQAVPASPDPVVVKQPDGTKITVFIRGDEWNNWLETTKGEVVVQNPTTRTYVYARPAAGGGVAPTSSVVGKVRPPLAPFKPKTPASAAARRAQAAEPAIPLIGTAKVLTILVTYSDTTESVPKANFDTMLFSSGAGSMKTLYEEMSRGTFSVSAGDAGILGWYKAPQNRAYYGQNLVAPQSGQNYPKAAELVRDAVLIADAAGVDFAPYDEDNDGKVDVVNIVHQGPGEETSAQAADIWSHRWDLNSSGVGAVTVDGKQVNDYIMNAEMAGIGGTQNTIGVFAHEYGHALGLPDLYDIDYSSEGLGNWSLMAGGSYNRTTGASGSSPAHMDAWCKSRLNWVTPINVTTNQIGASIPQVRTSGTVYKLRTSQFATNEYYLVENRQKTGFDAGLPGEGLCIYHIDDSVAGNNADNSREWYPGKTSSGHYRVALEQADGLFDLERRQNNGNAGDVWPGSTTKRTFSSSTAPDSKPYSQVGTHLAVKNISNSALTMTADLIVNSAGAGQTMTLTSPAHGSTVISPVAVRATTTNNSAFSRVDFSYRPFATVLSRTPGLAIPDNTTVSDTANSAASGNIVSATLTVDISHTWISDLLVTLVAPDGTRHVVHNRAGGNADNIAQSYNLSTALAGKPQAGAWKLEINDNVAGDPGVLNSWSLAFGDPTFIAIGADTDGANVSGEWTTSWNSAALPVGVYEVKAVATDTDGVNDLQDVNTFTLSTVPVASSGLLISEFRFHGTTPSDEYVELYNTTGTPLNISGWKILTSTGNGVTQPATVPAGTTIPARGHFIFTGAGYTLSDYSNYGSNSTTNLAQTPASIGADAASDSGVALLNAANEVKDQAGFATSLAALREGTGLPTAPNVDGTATSQHAFMRKFSGALPKDSGDNASDFVLLSTDGAPVSRTDTVTNGDGSTTTTLTSIPAQLGSPNPESLSSPTNINASVGLSLLDPNANPNAAPNRVRDGVGSQGTLLLRRTLKNNTGQTITGLRLLVTRITSQNSPGGLVATPPADVRLISSQYEGPGTIPGAAPNVEVFGLRLETPSNPPTLSGSGTTALTNSGGGGLGASVAYDVVLTTPLAPNDSANYGFNLQIAKSGTYLVAFNVLAITDSQ